MKNKRTTLLLMAPVNTVSGYGARSRDVAQALIASDKYDISIWPTRWGNTPMNALNDQDEKDKLIIDRCLATPKMEGKPDIFIQITVPNEFQQIGKYNIGITAGIETTIAAAPWIEGCNKMDLILVSSEHSKKVLSESTWQKMDQQTKQPIGHLKLEKPIEVLFEGVDPTTYYKTSEIHQSVDDCLKQVKEDYAFLFVGHWLKGHFGEDRKNISGLIRTFLETYKNKAAKNMPALVLKTSHADFSPLDKKDLLDKLEQIYESVPTKRTKLPNVYIIHGDLTNDEMNSLYNHPKVKSHITFTKGEGYGRPLAEASLSEKPIIAPHWGGHIDFVKHSIQIPGKLTNVHESAAWENVILKEAQWMSVDFGQASEAMKFATDKKNKKACALIAKRQATTIKKSFMISHMQDLLTQYLDQHVPEFPKEVMLKLPVLKPTKAALKRVEKNLKNLSDEDRATIGAVADKALPKLKLPKLTKHE